MPFERSLPGETPIDLSGLKNRSITNRRELSIAEAEAIRPVVARYLWRRPSRRTAPFTFDWVLKLHREMFGAVWNWAGTIRSRDLNVGIPYFNVSAELYSLLQDVAVWSTATMPLDEQATRLHHQAVRIHPFENGNGRWARLLANIWLKQQRGSVVAWPEAVIGDASAIRHEYLSAVRAADDGDYQPLLLLHQRFAEQA